MIEIVESGLPAHRPHRNPGDRKTILLVDDDQGIRTGVEAALVAHDYRVTTAVDGIEALAAFEHVKPDLVLLELVMPRMSGLELCRRIRENSATPIIVLSARGGEADIVSMFDLGADDYLVKPFRLTELRARVSAVLRRGGSARSKNIVCGDLEIDSEKRKVTLRGRTIALTPIEYALLAELGANAGRVLTTRLLLQRVWGSQYADEICYVKGVIRRLRVKLEPDPGHPRYILTEPHVGYRLDDAIEHGRSSSLPEHSSGGYGADATGT